MEPNKSYAELVQELEAMVISIENPDRPLSDIASDVQKALALIKECKATLRGEKEAIDKILNE